MIKLTDAVLAKPSFTKIANFELDEDTTNWKEKILEKFFEDVSYLPKDVNIEVVINDLDDKTGYAKGSVVVWYNARKVNFPIIIKDYQLSPFDIFVTEKDKKFHYHNATETNVKTFLMSNEIGRCENMYDSAMGANVKTPGNISPKRHVNLSEDYNIDYISAFPNFTKMSADMDYLKDKLEKNADIMNSFQETTGDLINSIINLNLGTQTQPKEKTEGKIDLSGVVKAKQVQTVMDSEFMDANKMIPIKAPSVCELRMFQYPSMEDFMDRGESSVLRFEASKNGKPITGVVIDYKDAYTLYTDCCCEPSPNLNESDPIKAAKAKRNSRPQIFLSADGKYYSQENDYSKSGICFYGSKVLDTPGMMDKTIERIAAKTTNDYLRYNKDNHGDGSDKSFPRNLEMRQGSDNMENKNGMPLYTSTMAWPSAIYPSYANMNKSLLCIYGAKDVYECTKFQGAFKRYKVNGSTVFSCNDIALIPSGVISVQQVSSVVDPVYKMVVGNAKKVYLIPETSIIINMDFMEQLSPGDFITPGKDIKTAYENAAITKVAVYLGDHGYQIKGDLVKPLQKIAVLSDDTCYQLNDAVNILTVLGVEKTAAKQAFKNVLIKQASNEEPKITIYGVNGDYINKDVYAGIEKQARIKEIYRGLALELKTDLIKEASVISDPEAVDVMLNLNFINEDNLQDYISQIHIMKKVIGKLSGMLIASRMGLSSDVDESAVKKAIDGIDSVVRGLENIKLSIKQ